jgi:2'-5' RNA ligase
MRLFLATTFPAAILRDLNARVTPIRPKLPPASWVREETQHLTLAFLGEQPESLVETLTPVAEAQIAKLPRFEATLRGCGLFPTSRRPRVGWVGVDPEPRFTELAGVVRDAVRSAGVTLDGDTFKPHLTLMRIRDSWPPASVALFERSMKEYQSEPFTVDRVTVYSSSLKPSGAVHTALREIPLK